MIFLLMKFLTPYEKFPTRKCLIHMVKQNKINPFKKDYDMDSKICPISSHYKVQNFFW